VRGGYIGVPRHEAEFNFQQQSSEDARKGTDITIDITRWDLSYVYNLKVKKPESKLIPLLNFGVGVMSYDNGSDSDSSTTFRAGGGIRVMFNPHLALRFDASIWHFHGDSVIIPRDGWFVFDATLGVSFVFGGGGA
jgi:hypothetical protein